MAKKNEFYYGNVAIPNDESRYSIIRWGWDGINRTDKIDTGQLTDASGCVADSPYIYALKDTHLFVDYEYPISVFGFDNNLLVIYYDDGAIYADVIKPDGTTYTGKIHDENPVSDGNMFVFDKRMAVQFNVATNTESIPSATFDRRIVILPDRYTMPYEVDSDFQCAYLGNTYPELKYGTVYGSRLFGVDDNLLYASAYNDYADWELDTADDINEGNAWVSMSQSNTKADGTFTAIATYDNHVVAFKKDFMQLVYNNKNPFRIVDVGSYGCDNAYAVAEMGGVLYFASGETVYAYGGGVPRDIGVKLDIDDYSGAVLGAYKDTLYMYANGQLYTYKGGVWSCLGVPADGEIKQFATLDYGICALFADGEIRFLDWSETAIEELLGDDAWDASYTGDWWFETDLMAAKKLDVRRVKKISMLCDMEAGSNVSVYLLRANEVFNSQASMLVDCATQPVGTSGMVMLRCMMRQNSSYMHRLRIAGNGKVRVYAAEIKLSWGGDLYVDG